jgi:lysophospholipase L1-like esterase
MIQNFKLLKLKILSSIIIFLIILAPKMMYANETVGLVSPDQNQFYLKSTNEAGGAELTFVYGPPGARWLPVMGDWDGDGIDTVGLFDPQANRFHLRNSNSAGGAEFSFVYGPPGAGWLPVTHQLTPNNVAAGGIIIDNGNTGFDSLGTNWTTSATEPGFFGENYQFAPAGDGSDSVSWAFQINSPGQYKIFAQWPTLVSGSPEATYSIINNDIALGTVQKDQRIDGGQFIELGAFELEVGTLEVVLQSSPSGAVAADAVFVGKGGLIQIVNPVENDLETNPSPSLKAVAINFPAGWGVEFVVKDFVTGSVVQTVSDFDAPFEQMASNLPLAKYIAEAHMVNQFGIRQQASDQSQFGIGDYYVGIGDSITYGTGDDIATDNMSNDGRNNSAGGGYTPILNNLLTAAKGYPHTVFNEGVPGDKSLDGVNAIDAVLEKHPNAKFFLVQYGTNDSHNLRVPSGAGLSPDNSGYAGTFKDNMQQILDAIIASGKTPILAKLPITFGSSSRSEPFSDPDSAERNLLIQEYNQVIGELISANGLPTTTPDFYSYFRANPSLMADNLHPDGLGYQGMAELWSNTLTGGGGP